MQSVHTARLVVVLASILAMTCACAGETGPGQGDRSQPRLTCSGAVTLETLAACIQEQMPGRGFVELKTPAPAVRNAWRRAVRSMLAGECGAAALPRPLRSLFVLAPFTDEETGGKYCVLTEVLDADRDGSVDGGWGTFVVSLHPEREVGIQVPHPIDELGTLEEGLRIFQETGARYLLLAGTHRNAARAESACQALYDRADVTHNVDNLFHAAVEEIATLAARPGSGLVSLQLHGMARESCPGVDVLLSSGVAALSGAEETLWNLRDRLAAENPDWAVAVPGDGPACEKEGTLNVQGRLLNGVPEEAVCELPATRATGRFIHIEQKPAARDAVRWIKAIRETFVETGR